MSRRGVWIRAGLLAVVVAAAVTGWLWAKVWCYPARDNVTISWADGGRGGSFTIEVADATGRPIAGVRVNLLDTSLGGGGTTGADGRWVYQPDMEMLQLHINDVLVFRRDGFVGTLLAPTPGDRGTIVRLVITNPAAFGLP